MAKLQSEQAGDLLQVVLDAVVHLLHQRGAHLEFGVLDADRSLLGEHLQGADLVSGEVVRLERVARQHAYNAVLQGEGHTNHGAQALLDGEVVPDVVLLRKHVRHDHGRPEADGAACDGLPELDRPLALVGAGGGLRGAQHQLAARLVQEPNGAHGVVELLRGEIHKQLQDLLEVRAR